MGRTVIREKKKEEDEVLYCLCRKPDDGDFMVGCDFCNEWYHGRCVGVSRKQAADIKRYSCPKCQPKNPIVYAPRRQDDDYSSSQDEEESEDDESSLPKRRLSNTTPEPQRKIIRTDQPIRLRASQEVKPLRTSQGLVKPLLEARQQRDAKRDELDENRKKSRQILLDALQQGVKQDKINVVVSAAAQKRAMEDPNLSEEAKAAKIKSLQEEVPEFIIAMAPAALANAIESELYNQLYLKEIASWKDYNGKLRSLAFNLKDPKNPLLRGRLLSKDLDPSQLPAMSSADLANRDLTIMRQKLAEQAVKSVTIDTKDVETALQMEKKWKSGGKGISEYSSAEDIVPTQINSSLPRPTSPSAPTEDGEEPKAEGYGEDTLPEDIITYGEGEDAVADGGEGAEADGSGEVQIDDEPEREEDNLQLDIQGIAPSSVPALETKPSLPLPLPPKVVWEGVLDMSTMSEMPSAGYLKKKCHTRALYISGPDMKEITIDPSMPVKGKISIPKLFGYLAQIEASPSRAVTVAAVEPNGDDNTLVYKTAYNYFIEQQRAAVFSVRPGTGQLPSLEEVYVTPVPENIPHDFPSLLRPPFRGSVSINGKLLAVFIMRTAPASTPYGKGSSPRRKSSSSHRSSGSSSSSSSSNGTHNSKTSPSRKDRHQREASPPSTNTNSTEQPVQQQLQQISQQIPQIQSPTPQIPSPIQQQQQQMHQIAQLQQLQQQLQMQQQMQQMQQAQQLALNPELLANLVRMAESSNMQQMMQQQQQQYQQYPQNGNQGNMGYPNNQFYK